MPSRNWIAASTSSLYCSVRDQADARRRAALDLVLQTGSRAIGEEAVRAVPEQEQLLQFFQGLANGARTRIRAEIAPLAASRTAMKPKPRKLGVGRRIDVGVTLVVAQQDVVARFVRLIRLYSRISASASVFVTVTSTRATCSIIATRLHGLLGAMEVTRHAFFQVARLADVDHLVLGIEHQVDTGPMRQAAQERLSTSNSVSSLTCSSTLVTAARAPSQRYRRTSAPSGARYWCCSGSSDRNPAAGMRRRRAARHGRTCTLPGAVPGP